MPLESNLARRIGEALRKIPNLEAVKLHGDAYQRSGDPDIFIVYRATVDEKRLASVGKLLRIAQRRSSAYEREVAREQLVRGEIDWLIEQVERLSQNPGRALLIETKVPGKDLRPLQRERIRRWRRAGAVVAKIDSFKDATALVERFMEVCDQ